MASEIEHYHEASPIFTSLCVALSIFQLNLRSTERYGAYPRTGRSRSLNVRIITSRYRADWKELSSSIIRSSLGSQSLIFARRLHRYFWQNPMQVKYFSRLCGRDGVEFHGGVYTIRVEVASRSRPKARHISMYIEEWKHNLRFSCISALSMALQWMLNDNQQVQENPRMISCFLYINY